MKVLSCYLGIKFFDRHRRLNYLQSKKATQLVSQQYFHHFLQTFIQFKRTELGFCVLKRQKQIVLMQSFINIYSLVLYRDHLKIQRIITSRMYGELHFFAFRNKFSKFSKKTFSSRTDSYCSPISPCIVYKASFSIVDISVQGLNIHVTLTCP